MDITNISNSQKMDIANFIISIGAALLMVHLLTNNSIYVLLPLWFLFSELLFDLLKKYSDYAMVICVIIAFILTLFITIAIIIEYSDIQTFENSLIYRFFTLFTLFASIFSKYKETFTQTKQEEKLPEWESK